jgi:hypothetical protein
MILKYSRLVMQQLGYHSTPNYLMQQIITTSDIKIYKTQGRVKCIRGLPWLVGQSGSSEVPQISNPTSTGGFPSSGA